VGGSAPKPLPALPPLAVSCVLCGWLVDRRVMDMYDSARLSQFEQYLQSRLRQRRELTVPASRRPVQLTTAQCYVGARPQPASVSDAETSTTHQDTEQDDDDDEDIDDDY